MVCESVTFIVGVGLGVTYAVVWMLDSLKPRTCVAPRDIRTSSVCLFARTLKVVVGSEPSTPNRGISEENCVDNSVTTPTMPSAEVM